MIINKLPKDTWLRDIPSLVPNDKYAVAKKYFKKDRLYVEYTCTVCGEPLISLVGAIGEVLMFKDELVENGEWFYIVCGETCEELLRTNPLAYE